jgi:hypothetical protein
MGVLNSDQGPKEGSISPVKHSSKPTNVKKENIQNLSDNRISVKTAKNGVHKPNKAEEKKGSLICNGKNIDSEIIYWKVVPGNISNISEEVSLIHLNDH